jgi:hypothetical protein
MIKGIKKATEHNFQEHPLKTYQRQMPQRRELVDGELAGPQQHL